MKSFYLIAFFSILLLSCTTSKKDQTSYNPIDYAKPLRWLDQGSSQSRSARYPGGHIQVVPFVKSVVLNPPGAGATAVMGGFAHHLFSNNNTNEQNAIRIVPTFGEKDIKIEPAFSTFSLEAASPGFYKAKLDSFGIFASMTATKNTVLHEYHFQDGWAHILVDLSNEDETLSGGMIRFNGPQEMIGYALENVDGTEEPGKIWFVIRFDRTAMAGGLLKNGTPLPQSAEIVQGKKIAAYFSYRTLEGGKLHIKVAMARSGLEEAFRHLELEQAGWSFPLIRQRAREAWTRALSRIQVDSPDETAKELFYTAYFRALEDYPFISDSVSFNTQSAIEELFHLLCKSDGLLAKMVQAGALEGNLHNAHLFNGIVAPYLKLGTAVSDAAAQAVDITCVMLGLLPDCEQGLYLVAPFFRHIELATGDSTFTIDAPNASTDAMILKKAKLNSARLDEPYVSLDEIKAGGHLVARTRKAVAEKKNRGY